MGGNVRRKQLVCKSLQNHSKAMDMGRPDPVAFSRQCEKSVSPEYRDALIFTGFDLEAFETVLFSYVGTVATLILLLGIDLSPASFQKF